MTVGPRVRGFEPGLRVRDQGAILHRVVGADRHRVLVEKGGTSERGQTMRKPSSMLVCFLALAVACATEVRSQGLMVDCDSGGTIRAALGTLKPGDTLTWARLSGRSSRLMEFMPCR